jgi:bifunctional non-homologous end joining protein LigD
VKTSRKAKSGASAHSASAKRRSPKGGTAVRRNGGQRGRLPSKPSLGGVRITHPERVVYPEAALTKLMVAEYYARVAERLLPFIADRPLAIVRCPDGLNAQCFFQKHVGRYSIPGVEVFMVDESTGRNPYAIANAVEALVGLAQWNAIELHAWGSTAPQIDKPDTLVLDLDPDPALPWSAVVTAARDIRALLEAVGVASFVKTTGGKGLHVVVPLVRRHGWDEVRQFARAVALHLARKAPERFVATPGESNRRGKIFIDYLRNSRGATAVVPYSLRARPGATVATPLAWDELSDKTPPSTFTLKSLPRRIEQKRDPWANFGRERQRLSAKALTALS